jgi:hypothetical protein
MLVHALALLAVLSQPTAAEAKQHQILFYDPDANYTDMAAISTAFASVLDRLDDGWSFQAVQQRESFEMLANRTDAEFAFVASAYLRSGPAIKLAPLLVPSSQGDIYYRKQLVGKGSASAHDLVGKNIAVSGPADDAAMRELSVLGVSNPLLLAVPKDVDALMALYFGQADGALVTPSSIEVFRRVNPKAVAAFRVVLETKKILRSPFCALDHASKESQATIIRALQHLADTPEGRSVMRYIAFDSWVRYETGMLK